MADLIFTCPPYGNLERYSDDPADISTMEYPEFMTALVLILDAAAAKLNRGGYLGLVVGDFRDTATGNYRGFVADTIIAMRGLGLALYNEAILVTPAGTLPVRVSFQFDKGRKLGKSHQNVLIFRRAA
jgi:hypothetical protein